MTEANRVKTYYRPRIQVPLEVMFNEPGEYAFYCLPKDGVSLLRRILDYGHRQITYIDEVIDNTSYLVPDSATMVLINDIVEKTGVGLMSECNIDLVIDAIDRNTAAIEALQCVCVSLQRNQSGELWGNDVVQYLQDGTVIPTTDQPDESITAQQDADACAIAQLYYAFAFEVITETVLPAAASTFDTLIPILAGVIAGIASGGMAAIAMYGVAELVQELIELQYVVAEENYRNWLWSVKDEWICEAYQMLKDGANASSIAATIAATVIEPSTEISFGDKLVTKLFGGILAVRNAKAAWEGQTSWAQNNVTPGYCAICPEPVPSGCLAFEECDLAAWTGGSVDCSNYGATLKGGLARWTEQTMVVPTNGHLSVRWYPRTDGYPTARASFGLYRASDLHYQEVIVTTDKNADTATEDYALIPSYLWGQECYFGMKQESYWCEPVWWCLLDAAPTHLD